MLAALALLTGLISGAAHSRVKPGFDFDLPIAGFFSLISAGGALLLVGGRRWRWLWRFTRQVRRFRTVTNGRIALHFAPELNDKWHMPTLLQRCQEELNLLTERFGSPLRGHVVVFLFAFYRDIGTIFGPRYGGAALSFANAIVIADDNNVQESMRHEFAHLFSARWNLFAPPLLKEGLSVWLQETIWGQSIDNAARLSLGNPSLRIPLLLKPSFFFAEPQRHACYALAGSFTGFLVRRFGWQQYHKFFRHCNGIRFRAKFKKCFGVTLEKAEWQWRNEVNIMPILNARVRRNTCR
jgi:hypothetical protein